MAGPTTGAPGGSDAAPIGVAVKWVDLRPEVDRLTGHVAGDERFAGCSPADRAALEWALRIGAAWDREVVVVSAGPTAVDDLLRDGLAVGAARAVRVDQPVGAASEEVAAGLATVLDDCGLVCCGDWSVDRGSGAVPAFLAARLARSQALGLVSVEVADTDGRTGRLRAVRRLDHGRREILDVAEPAVVSFEGGTATLRRAPLAAVLAARDAHVDVVAGPSGRHARVRTVRTGPARPRARALPPPDQTLGPRERILALTGALVEHTPARTVVTDDAEVAADLVVDQLRAWGVVQGPTMAGITTSDEATSGPSRRDG
ncbi:MAG: mycofactocin-associated electron transfer flavoprotein beta subunit [Acidimicrobiales bacterium]